MQKNKGFTLIELLVVIAIIGILASVVLASLSSARQKGADAKIQAQLSNMRAQAEIYYGANGNTYGTASTGTSCTEAGTMFADANGLLNLLAGVANPVCVSTGTAWAVSAPLVSDATQSFCVDSLGTAETGTKVATTGVCATP